MATYRESFIVRIACDPPALFWTGFGGLPLVADAVIPDDAVAIGAGELISIPDFQQLMNGTAERLDAEFSGVSEETLRLAMEDAESVRGARVDVGRINFDSDWQQDGSVEWEAVFEARKLAVAEARGNDGGRRSITCTIVAGETTRSRAANAHWTDADQKRRPGSEDDLIFDHVAGITAGVTRRWGPK